MNDLAENNDLDDQNQDLDQDQDQEQEQEQENTGLTLADKAAEMGHQPLEDWVNNGGDADLWQTPETFLQLKPALTRLKDQGREIKRLKSENVTLTSIYSNQVDSLRQQLTQQRSEAVQEGDEAKFNQVQGQIDKLPTQTIVLHEPDSDLSPFMQNWNADPKNDWYRTNEVKQALANQRFTVYQQQGYSEEQTVVLMKQDVDRLVPDINHNRTNAPRAEGGSKPGNKPKANNPTMNDLTSEESRIWRSGHMMFKNEKEFLEMVAKSREDENE